MKKAYVRIIAVLGFVGVSLGQDRASAPTVGYPYSAAFISTIGARRELVVFPFRGGSFNVPIRSVSGGFLYSPEGEALYGSCTPYPETTYITLCKIDLYTGSVTPMSGAIGMHSDGPGSMAVSNRGDRILFAGLDRLFERTIPDGAIRTKMIFPHADGHPWLSLNLSPDGERAVAAHNGRVELIDIVRGTVEPLGGELFMAAWSPDGKWLAATEKGEHGRTILMDARTLARRRILGPSELDWSPDSHYLLGMKPHDRCGPYYGTLEAINVETGERTTIKSSACQVNQATTGWVRSDISGK